MDRGPFFPMGGHGGPALGKLLLDAKSDLGTGSGEDLGRVYPVPRKFKFLIILSGNDIFRCILTQFLKNSAAE